jgi:hypothetical protein
MAGTMGLFCFFMTAYRRISLSRKAGARGSSRETYGFSAGSQCRLSTLLVTGQNRPKPTFQTARRSRPF